MQSCASATRKAADSQASTAKQDRSPAFSDGLQNVLSAVVAAPVFVRWDGSTIPIAREFAGHLCSSGEAYSQFSY
jgi:hypothetical protein